MPLQYKRLDGKRNEIRVIKILPAPSRGVTTTTGSTKSEPVTCSLEHVSLDDYTSAYADFLNDVGASKSPDCRAMLWDRVTVGESALLQIGLTPAHPNVKVSQQDLDAVDQNPKYQDRTRYHAGDPRWGWGDFSALSYVWGKMNETRQITIDGQSVKVTPNLYQALRSVRSWMEKYKWHYIWIDALCINQEDLDERNIEVRRMQTIFAEAHTVLAWVGCQTAGTATTIGAVEQIARLSVTAPLEARKHIDAVRTLQHVYDDSIWKGLLDLVCCTYWSRLWIIQEVGLANMRATLLWGDCACSLHYWLVVAGVLVQDLYTLFHQKSAAMGKHLDRKKILEMRKWQFALLIEMSRSKLEGQSLPDLMALLQRGRHADEFDARDKIYGLLGLISPQISAMITPDYRSTPLDVYRNFSRTVIMATGKLDIICQGRSNILDHHRHPSWVVDWSVPPEDLSGWKLSANIFRASGDSRHEFKDSGDGDRLLCQALEFDTVDALGCSLAAHTDASHDVITSSALANPYNHKAGIRNAILETMVLGQMAQLAPSVAAHLKSLPWLSKTDLDNPTGSPFYQRIARFQQCNRTFTIAARNPEHYFPKRPTPYNVSTATLEASVERAIGFITTMIDNRRLMKTRQGYLGLVPKNSQSGDLIGILKGCSAPVVLRQSGNAYKVIGESYIHGIMKGAAWKSVLKDPARLKDIVLC